MIAATYAPNNRLQWTGLRAATEPKRWAAEVIDRPPEPGDGALKQVGRDRHAPRTRQACWSQTLSIKLQQRS